MVADPTRSVIPSILAAPRWLFPALELHESALGSVVSFPVAPVNFLASACLFFVGHFYAILPYIWSNTTIRFHHIFSSRGSGLGIWDVVNRSGRLKTQT